MSKIRYIPVLFSCMIIPITCACNRIMEDDIPDGRGKEIVFNVASGYTPQTRTVFSGVMAGESSEYERIDWVNGDLIRVYCNEASIPGNKMADVTVGAPTADGRYSTASASMSRGGMYWGEGPHTFYALYPSPSAQNSLSKMDANVIGGIVPREQTVSSKSTWYYSNMLAGYMYAVTTVDAPPEKPETQPGSPVSLTFYPLMTAFEFSLYSSPDDPVTPPQATNANHKKESYLQTVTLKSESTYLSGSFSATLAQDGTVVALNLDEETLSKEISLTLNGTTGVALSTTTPVKVTLLGLPVDQTELILSLTFNDGTVREHQLKEDGVWISVPACQKMYLTNEKVPGMWKWYLEHDCSKELLVDLGDADHTLAQETVREESTSGASASVSFHSYKTTNSGANRTAVDINKTQYEYAKADIFGDLELDDQGKIVWLPGLPSELTKVTPTVVTDYTKAGYSTATFNATLVGNNGPYVIESVESGLLAHARSLKRRGTNGFSSSSPQDLSLYDIENLTRPRSSGRPTTANCYVVDRAGWYMFPVVYGNAIDYSREGAPLYSNGVNQYAYKDETTTANTGTYFHNFQRYDAASVTTGLIQSPYILDDLNTGLSEENRLGISDYEAVVVWEDVPGADYSMVQNVSLSEIPSTQFRTVDGTLKSQVPYIKFEIPVGAVDENVEIDPSMRVTGIREGNAVIALRRRSDGLIVWSWHIWISDGWDVDGDGAGDTLSPVTVLTRSSSSATPVSTANEVMRMNLGWCEANTIRHHRDHVWYVRIRQSEGPCTGTSEPIVFKVTHRTMPGITLSDGTYYQWGRKDPFLPSRGSVVTSVTSSVTKTAMNKESYSPSGYTLANAANTAVSFSSGAANNASLSIRNPYIQYYHNNNGWMSSAVYNLWNIAAGTSTSENVVYKTVYDPCPPGYCVPHLRAFTVFTTNGGDQTTNYSNYNIYDLNGDGSKTVADFTNTVTTQQGWHFYTDDSMTEKTFIPALGYRINNTGVVNANAHGYNWLATPNNANNGNVLYTGADVARPFTATSRSHGMAVRAVREYSPGSGVSTGGMDGHQYEHGNNDWGY